MTTYTFDRQFSPQVIPVFAAGSDLLDFSKFNLFSFDQLTPFLSTSGGNTTINLFYNGVAETLTVKSHVLSAADFIFNTAPGDLTVSGTVNDDVLFGGDGNDTFTMGTGVGVDNLSGGKGNDVYYVHLPSDSVIELAGEGTDQVATFNSYVMSAGAEIELLTTNNGTATRNLSLTGNEFAQTIHGNAGKNVLSGLGGNDTLWGGDGNDVLIGGAGADNLLGGEGTDVADYSSSMTGVLASLKRPGLNTGDAAGDTYTSVENLIGTAKNDNLRGNDYWNTINGGTGDDYLYGGAGNDNLTGGRGYDTFVFNTGFSFGGASNLDTIHDFVSTDDRIFLWSGIYTEAGTPGGKIETAAFRRNITGEAIDADDRIIFDSQLGRLYYDADGTGPIARQWFANIGGFQVGVDASDFYVV